DRGGLTQSARSRLRRVERTGKISWSAGGVVTMTTLPTDTPVPVNILVVDDRLENRVALRALLTEPDYQIVEAASAREALKQLLDVEFAVLLVDVVMPEMSGLELAQLIRTRERNSSVPILFLTAVATDLEAIYRAYTTGAVDYLVK